MALEPLATADDLVARGVDTTNTTRVTAMLKAASSAVRDAAGSPISSKVSTVDLVAPDDRYLRLPGGPITAVSAVLLDGVAVTNHIRSGDSLWLACGWRSCDRPSTVRVTYTHGFVEVDEDIIDLVCALAAAGINSADEGYGTNGNVAEEAIDDHRTAYVTGADAQVSVMELPERTKQMLRTRFGHAAVVTSSR